MKQSTIIIGIIVITVVLFLLRKPIDKEMAKLTRGYKNKNPGNIRKTQAMWKGEVQGTDKDFKTFQSMPWGYCALAALLREYLNNGYNTIDKIINRYAPGNENNTTAYIATVSKKTGIDPNTNLFFEEEKIKKLMRAISYVENGMVADDKDIDAGFALLT